MRLWTPVAAVAALLAGAGLVQPAQAKWIEVGSAANGVKIFVDADTLSATEHGVQLSQRFLFPRAPSQRLSRVDQQVFYACNKRTVRTLKSTEYDRAGRISRVDKADATPPYRIVPGTLPQYVWDLVC